MKMTKQFLHFAKADDEDPWWQLEIQAASLLDQYEMMVFVSLVHLACTRQKH